MKLPLVCLLATFLSITACLGQDPSIPTVVVKGFEIYQRDGTLAAVNSWFAGSARETEGGLQDEAVDRLNRVSTWLGSMFDYELVRSVPLSASTRRVYLAVKYQKGVAWMWFDCYRPGEQWIVTRFDFSTNANNVLPENILGGQ